MTTDSFAIHSTTEVPCVPPGGDLRIEHVVGLHALQALRAQPLIIPDAVTLVALGVLGVLGVGVAAAAALVLRGRDRYWVAQ